MAKHPPEAINNQLDHGGRASAREEERQSIRYRRRAAKYPPKDNLHRSNSDEVDEIRRSQAQKQELSEESRRPPLGPGDTDFIGNQLGFQDDASNEGATPQAPLSSDQRGQCFHLKSTPERREMGNE